MKGLVIVAVLLTPAAAFGQVENVLPPDEVIEHFSFLVGTWELTPDVPNPEWKGEIVVKWGPGKYCLTSSARFEGVLDDGTKIVTTDAGMDCWDPGKKKIVSLGCGSLGHVNRTVRTITSPGVAEGEQVHTSANGEEQTMKVKFERKSPNELLFTAGEVGLRCVRK